MEHSLLTVGLTGLGPLPLGLFGFGVLLYLVPILLWGFAAGWVTWDAVQRTGEWGWLWGLLAFGCAPVVVPIYLLTTVWVDRPAPAWVQREREYQKDQVTKFKGMSEFERVRYIEAAAGGAGTLYSGEGLRPSENGAKLFPDAHADSLLAAKQFDDAFIYLYDLYLLAVEDNDPRGEQTYKWYLTQVPQGLDLLQRARDRQLTPGVLKAGGMELVASAVPVTVNRPRPVTTNPTTAPQHLPETKTTALPDATSLERLINAPEELGPRGNTTPPVRPVRPAGSKSKIPF